MINIIHKDYFAIDISDSSIEMVKLKAGGKEFIEAWGRIEIGQGLVSNGRILKPESLACQIKELLKRTKPAPIEDKSAVCHLPDSQVYLHILKLPRTLNQTQIKRVIDNEIDSFFPFAKEELYWQNRLLSASASEQEILVAAVPSEIVDGYLRLFKLLGIRLLALGVASESIARSLIKEYNNNEAILLVDIGKFTSLLALFDRMGVRNSVNINIAGEAFTKALAEKLKITSEQAEQLKINSGFDETKEEGRVFLILQSVSQILVNEIKKTIDYYRIQTGSEVKKIIITGGSTKLAKIDEYLAKNLNLPVEKGVPWFELPKEIDPSIYSAVIGLASIRQPEFLKQSINFLGVRPREKTKILEKSVDFLKNPKVKLSKKALIYAGILIAFIVILGLLIFKKKVSPTASKNFLLINQSVESSNTDNKIISSTSQDNNSIINSDTATTTPTSSTDILPSGTEEKSEVASLLVEIVNTPTGWLNVRSGPGTNYLIIKKIYPDENYALLSTSTDWLQIRLSEDLSGWISSVYGRIIEE